MKMGIVTGTVVSTVKQEALLGLKLLVVQEADTKGKATGGHFLIAADAVGAGIGDVVLTASGSSARLTDVTKEKPVDAVIVGIVDYVEIGKELTYRKYEPVLP
jgi:microcompartment protein CcmK/EutM